MPRHGPASGARKKETPLSIQHCDVTASAPEERPGRLAAFREIFSRNFLLVAAINFFMLTAYYVIFVTSASYAIKMFRATPSEAGFVAGIIVIGCLAARFFTGYFIGVLGCKVVLFAGLVIFTGSTGLFLVVDSLAGLYATRFICGVGVGLIGTAIGAIVAYVVPKKMHGKGVGFFSLSVALALAAGPFLAVTLTRFVDYPTLFLICTGIGGVSCAVYFFLTISNRLVPPATQKRSLLDLRNYLSFRVLPFACVVLVAALCWGTIQAFVTFYAGELGMPGAASLFFLVYAATILLTRPCSGHIYDTRGPDVVLIPCLCLMACGAWVLGSVSATWTMLAAAFLLALGFGNFQSTAQAFSLALVPHERFPQATSTFFIFFDLGMGVGPFIFGLLPPLMGYGNMYRCVAGVALLALGLYLGLRGRCIRPAR